MATAERPKSRTLTGTVISNKMQKTVVVAVESLRKHRLYGKTVRRTKHFKAHDERNEAKIGDRVEIAESRPLSRDKHWTLSRILGDQSTAVVVHALEEHVDVLAGVDTSDVTGLDAADTTESKESSS
jgi:small subunit ribosomal protein S17